MTVSDDRANLNTPYATTSSSSATNHGEKRQHQSEEIKNKAKQTSEELREEARRRATSAVEQQKRMAADQTAILATALQHMADELDEQQQPYFSGCASNLARCTDTLSQRLRERDIDTLMSQVQDYTRRQPSLFIGGAVAAGFLLARFMRSSREHEQY